MKSQSAREVVEPEPPSDGHKRVFYLTSALFAISDIALRRIKVARFSDLNDPFELLGVDRSDLNNRAAVLKETREINEQAELVCFSRSWSNPVLWGHYAEKHTGICMGFDVPDRTLHEVIYRESLRPIKADPKTGAPKLTTADVARLKKTKFKDWEYEQEMRLFVDLRALKSESGKYFYPFSKELVLREVILGPRCEIRAAAIRSIVEAGTVVLKARLAFRSFKVVVDRQASGVRGRA